VRRGLSPAGPEEGEEPARVAQDVGQEGQLVEQAAGDQLLHAIAVVTLAEAGDGRVDGDDEPGEAGDARTLDRLLGSGPPTDEVELEEHRGGRGRLHVFERVAGGRPADGVSPRPRPPPGGGGVERPPGGRAPPPRLGGEAGRSPRGSTQRRPRRRPAPHPPPPPGAPPANSRRAPA